MDIIGEIRNGNKRVAARLISMIENGEAEAMDILKACWRFDDKARIIGITGPPGAGKSTLTDQLAKSLLKKGHTVGIIAVDPSSPITGGAFLGDRIRMSDLNAEPGVFIRSMGTRGALGGISKAVHGAIRVLELLGKDYIFIETVGVGQSETDVAGVADMVVLVTIPGAGDDIQAGKAGILEVADVIVVNKADHDDAGRTVQYLKSMLSLNTSEAIHAEADVEILTTIASSGVGIDELIRVIDRHYIRSVESGRIEKLQRQRLKSELHGLVQATFSEHFREYDEIRSATDRCIESILRSDSDPYSEAFGMLMEFYEWRSSKC